MVALILALMLPPRIADVAPAPREKLCSHRGSPDCLCPDGDLRCRARAALSLAAASRAVPTSTPEQAAAKKALQAAEIKIKAAKP